MSKLLFLIVQFGNLFLFVSVRKIAQSNIRKLCSFRVEGSSGGDRIVTKYSPSVCFQYQTKPFYLLRSLALLLKIRACEIFCGFIWFVMQYKSPSYLISHGLC